MKITLDNTDTNQRTNIATRCPHCGHDGTFLEVGISDLRKKDGAGHTANCLGIRRCPNSKCKGHLFFITDDKYNILLTSPAETIPFNKENIPETVLNAFEEAIKCHSDNCFIASAIMIRKTLEEVCHERGIKGDNLANRLKGLGTKILIPKELIEGMDDLRLLGNDAAHIEARTYNEIGKNEIEISLEFTIEILKAVYQYESLLKKMRSLKKHKEIKS